MYATPPHIVGRVSRINDSWNGWQEITILCQHIKPSFPKLSFPKHTETGSMLNISVIVDTYLRLGLLTNDINSEVTL